METEVNRNAKAAMMRGFTRRCPRCGRGHLFTGYLTPAETCDHCGLDLRPQRADDGPAYLTILIVGHLCVPLLVPAYRLWAWSPALMAMVFVIATVTLSLILLPRLKGLVIGFQWAKGMHGF